MTVKKIKKHFKYHGSSYLKLALVCSVFIGMIIVAVVTKDEKESEKSGDTQSSSLASASYEKKYGEAEELLASGNKAEAERLMKKMAFLSDDGVSPRGYAPAHLWMAKNMLKKLDPVFLYKFPLELKKGKHVVVPLSLREGDTVTLAQRHLEHADYLAPELKEPPLLLAALWIARAQREKAYKVLLSSICDKENPQVELIIPFVNLLNYEGDDIALQEMSWHALSILGRSVMGARRDNLKERTEYALSSMALKKVENVEVLVSKMQRDFASFAEGSNERIILDGLRLGLAYQKAVLAYEKVVFGDGNGSFIKVVNSLGDVLKVKPDTLSALDALLDIAKKMPDLKNQIKGIVDGVTLQEGNNEKAYGRLQLLKSILSGGDKDASRMHLENALKQTPDDVQAMMGLVDFLLDDEKPDFSRVLDLMNRVVQIKESSEAGGVDAKFYKIQAVAMMNLSQWKNAVVALEKVLPIYPEKKEIHALLSEAYAASGNMEIAEAHKLASQNK